MSSPTRAGRDGPPTPAPGLVRAVVDHSAVRYVAIGGCSFLLDLGLLWLCYTVLGMPLWLATAVGFWGSFVFNFFLQRRFSFGSTTGVGRSLWRYGVLLAVNTVATVVAVELAERSGLGFVAGKTLITVAQTVWTYFVYRHWVFAAHAPRTTTIDHHPET